MTFLLEEVKETILDFSHKTIELFSLKMIIYIYRMSLQLHDFTYIK